MISFLLPYYFESAQALTCGAGNPACSRLSSRLSRRAEPLPSRVSQRGFLRLACPTLATRPFAAHPHSATVGQASWPVGAFFRNLLAAVIALSSAALFAQPAPRRVDLLVSGG